MIKFKFKDDIIKNLIALKFETELINHRDDEKYIAFNI